MKVSSVDWNLKTKFMELIDCLKNCDRKYRESTDLKFARNIDRRYFNLKDEKNKIIIVVQYTMEHFSVSQNNIVNRNENIIDISP